MVPTTISRREPRRGIVVGTGAIHLPSVIEQAGERARLRRFVEFSSPRSGMGRALYEAWLRL